MLAFAWQSIVTQTHRHVDTTTVFGQSIASISNGDSDDQSPVDSPANCVICREVAHAGPALLPTGVTLDTPARSEFRAAASDLLRQQSIERSHRWQSRAPPQILHA
ncbi:hypothetical protein TS85_12925 [Sphingomonas hengshuiensis]|uniref:DUF2946 domain-containing protein n=1 Tax=Sphingomonas hengshuiensis TaxID=1609977 RepID=A0A7U4J926_9SPHN|nr:hypothetical protein TS85_12925 [Sphingomonas hengshuiensis]